MYVVRCKLKLHADCIEDSYAATEHQCAAQKSAQARPQYSMNVLVSNDLFLIHFTVILYKMQLLNSNFNSQ